MPPHATVDHVARLADRIPLTPDVIARARIILHATSVQPVHNYPAVCAVYIASYMLPSTHPQHTPHLSLSALLRAAPTLRIPHFFDVAKAVAADAAAHFPPTTPPPSFVHHSHHSFMVCADVWRKLRQLFDAGLLHHSSRLDSHVAWLFFLVCKAHLSSPSHSPLQPVSAFHLLLASLVEAGMVRLSSHADSPVSLLCTATDAVPQEVHRFQTALNKPRPSHIRHRLPFYPSNPHSTAHLVKTLSAEYDNLLASPRYSHSIDERVFIDSPHLLASSPSESSPSTDPATSSEPPPATPTPTSAVQEPVTPTRSPRKRSLDSSDSDMFQTPQKRTRFRPQMPVTPGRFSRISASPRADDLDALAAVACSTPRSGNRLPPRLPPVPSTPMAVGCALVSWLHNLADSRNETKNDAQLSCPPADLLQANPLAAVIDDHSLWVDLVVSFRSLCDKLCEAMPIMDTPQRRREATAVYFAAIEGILTREASRLAKQRHRFIENLLKNTIFHKTILTCAWEVTAAAYGRRDMAVFYAAMDAFGLSPFNVSKATESFVLRLPDMPRFLARHIFACEARILESRAWRSDSELVAALSDRAARMATVNGTVQNQENDTASQENTRPDTLPRSPVPVTQNACHVKDFALELFFKKLFSLASDRTQELILMLNMDAILDHVWSCLKYAMWEKWHLMVDRHVDQIIMCCIYGVAKVRRHQLKFKEIISTYRKMTHTREPSFSHLLPGVFRDLSTDPNIPSSEGIRTPLNGTEKSRGDIIKFYNQVFIHSMKAQLFRFQETPQQSDIIAPKIPPQRNTTNWDSRPPFAADCPTNMIFQSSCPAQEDARPSIKDPLSCKVLSSAMRMLRPHASPRRIGRVTVSPMSPGGRLAALRQSPARRGNMLGSMTPGTRTLYAFGESPVRNVDRGIRSASNDGARVRRPVPLNFEGRNVQVRSESIRRRYADVLGMARMRTASARLMTAGNGGPGDDSQSESQLRGRSTANGTS